MKKRVREFLQSKSLKVGVMCCVAMSMMVCTAFAAEGDPTSTTATITAAFQTGFQQVVSDGLNLIAVMVPIAMSLAGVIFLVRKAMSWWKSMAK